MSDEDDYFLEPLDTVDSWKGMNYFYCKGWFLTGPSGFKPYLMTTIFVLIPYILLMIFTAEVILIDCYKIYGFSGMP